MSSSVTGGGSCAESAVSEEDKVLYDISVPCEWPEVVSVLPAEEGISLWRALTAVTKAFVQFAIEKVQQPLKSLGAYQTVPPALGALLRSTLPWKLALTRDGTLLAVLKDEQVEIRSIVDEFVSVLTSCQVPRDPVPQWRKLEWNEEGSLLAIGMSTGSVCVYTSSGRLVCVLVEKVSASDVGTSSPLTSLTFVPLPDAVNKEKLVSLLCVLYHGRNLETFQIREEGPPIFMHAFSFADYFPRGVSSMLYHRHFNTLIIGASSTADSDSLCVIGWRLLDGSPHWTPMIGQETTVKKVQKSVLSGLRSFGNSAGQAGSGIVCSMAVSPSGKQLATIEVSGRLSVWDVPSLRLNKSWTLQEQPIDELSALDTTGSNRRNDYPQPVEVSWWSDKAMILVNTAGQVTVPSLYSLENLLGSHPEPGSAITHSCEGQFHILECESSSSSVRRLYHVPSLSEESEDEHEGSNSDSQFSIAGTSSSLMKQVLFFFTERDRFRPPNKKPKVTTRKYSLACLRSMPPEECYERKMMNEEYGEALLLAQQYGLNCDLVYQRQWLSCLVSIATIQDYLSKISKRSEVLHECINRVPEDYQATRELLQYGLSRTSYRELKEAGIEEEKLSQMEGLHESEGDLSVEDIERDISGWKNRLTSEQFSICQYRHLLLTYLDRLNTYQVFLGGGHEIDEQFDSCVFEEFRSGNLVKIAVNYARDGDWRAVDALFTYHGSVVLPHRLAILSNFPETLTPQTYLCLLPYVSSEGGITEWECDSHREEDWVESDAISQMCVLPDETHTNTGDFLYEENPDWDQYMSPTSPDVLTSWYQERAVEIEEFSGQVDCALQLLDIGVENGVQGLEVLHHQLKTLHTLVYQCNADSRLTLVRLKAMSNYEILQMMLKECSGSSFVSTFIECAVPYLSRLDLLNSGEGDLVMLEFLTQLAKVDLEPCLLLFLQSRGKGAEGDKKPVVNSNKVMSLALRVVYASERSDQLSIADRIVECLPVRAVTSQSVYGQELSDLHAQVDELENHLSALDVLQTYGVQKPVHYIRDIQNDPGKAKQLMIKLTRVASRRDPPMVESSWRNLLQHLLSLRSRVFSCLDITTCYTVFAESLLCSGQVDNIHLASHVLTLTPDQHSTGRQTPPYKPSPREPGSSVSSFKFHLPYDVSCDLVLNATKEYFNSAGSLMDKDMDLARECLSLFPFSTGSVQAELNLIASLSLLDDFGVSILPLQVRLTENKLDIVRSVLDSSPVAYKNYQSIIRLSRLLNLDEGDQVHFEVDQNPQDGNEGSGQMSLACGHTIILIVLAAMEREDFKLSESLCSRLVDANFSSAWEISRKLAGDGNLSDLSTRMDFMDFSLVHCPPEEIEDTLKMRHILQVQCLYKECTQGISKPSTRGSIAGTMQQLIRPRLLVEPEVKPTLYKLSAESLHFHINELKKIAEVHSREKKSNELVFPQYHEFFGNDNDVNSHNVSHKAFSYGDWTRGQSAISMRLALNQTLLRAIQVANSMIDKDEEMLDCNKVLLDLAKDCSSSDTHLLLGYLLALSKVEEANKLFSYLPKTNYCLKLAIYYVCLQLYHHFVLQSEVSAHLSGPYPYLHPPEVVMNHVTSHLTSSDETDWPELFNMLHKYQEKIEDLSQSDILHSLGLGIDIDRFEEDKDYQHTVIQSLARSLNDTDKVFSITCLLAERHGIPKWEVFMEQLDCLLTTMTLKLSEVQQRVRDKCIMEVLLCNSQQTCDRLEGTTYSKLPGDNLAIMLMYYSILQECINKGATIKDSPVDIATHVTLLKKLKANISGVDYKCLMSRDRDTLLDLQPALTANNVQVIAKIANKIPRQGGGVLTAGAVLRTFSESLFWNGDKQNLKPMSQSAWLHRYEACRDFLSKLGTDDMGEFVKIICFSDRSMELLDRQTRLELVKRCQRSCQQRVKQEETGFVLLKQDIEVYYKHLKNLCSPNLENVSSRYSLDQSKWEEYLKELDVSLSEPNKVHALCLRMLTDSSSLALLDMLLNLMSNVHPHGSTVNQLVTEAVQELVKNLSHFEPLEEDSVCISKLEKVLIAVSQHESQGGNLVSSSHVLDVLRPFCSDSTYNATSRRFLLQLIEKYLYLSDQDYSILLLYQTQSLLVNKFDTRVLLDDVSSSDSRLLLFSTLLGEAETVDKLLTLFSVLEMWETSCSNLIGCWSDLLLAVARKPDAICHVATIRAGLTGITSEVDSTLLEKVSTHSPIEALKLALVCSNKEMIQSTAQLDLVNMPNDDNSDLFELILITGSVIIIHDVHPLFYAHLCKYMKTSSSTSALRHQLFMRLLKCSESEISERLDLNSPSRRVRKLTQLLYGEGLVLEAGSLLLTMQEFPDGLRTMNDAVGYVQRLFPK